MMLKEYRHGLQTRASYCGYLRLELAGSIFQIAQFNLHYPQNQNGCMLKQTAILKASNKIELE